MQIKKRLKQDYNVLYKMEKKDFFEERDGNWKSVLKNNPYIGILWLIRFHIECIIIIAMMHWMWSLICKNFSYNVDYLSNRIQVFDHKLKIYSRL